VSLKDVLLNPTSSNVIQPSIPTEDSLLCMVAFYVNIEREEHAKQGGEADAKRIW